MSTHYEPFSRPVLFGKLAPASTGDGGALRITANLETTGGSNPYPYGNAAITDDLYLNKLAIGAASTNAGLVFICLGAAPFTSSSDWLNGGGASKVSGGVMWVLTPGQFWTITDPQKLNNYHAGDFQIVIQTGGDYAFAMGEVD